jgi:thiol oxidase
VAKVNCVAESALCTRWKVQGFPGLRFGHPADFAAGRSGEDVTGGPRSAEALLAWLNARLGQEWTLQVPAAAAGQAAPPPTQQLPPLATFPPPPVVPESGSAAVASARLDLGDAELATLLSFEYAVSGALLTAQRRDDFALWLRLLAAAHPVGACAAGAAALAEALPEAWPPGSDAPEALKRFRPCGVDRPRPAWGACAGSSQGSRGYSCGLWTLLHALAARVEPEHGAPLWLAGARAFVGSFFTCTDCASHFLARCEQTDTRTLTFGRGGSAAVAQLWAWRVHNEVNARLAVEEGATPADPAFPKRPWPSSLVCPECSCATNEGHFFHAPRNGCPNPSQAHDGLDWNEDGVLLYLARVYGPTPAEVRRGARGWDPFGINAVRGGRLLEQHEPESPLSLRGAPGGLPPALFIALCALSPVAAYAAFQRSTGKAPRLLRALARLLKRDRKSRLASLASLNGQGLKTV